MIFLKYWLIAGIYCFLHVKIEKKFFMTKERQEKIDEAFNSIPINKDTLFLILDFILLFFVGIILPFWIITILYKIFTGKELI